jgi:hypothetical protein
MDVLKLRQINKPQQILLMILQIKMIQHQSFKSIPMMLMVMDIQIAKMLSQMILMNIKTRMEMELVTILIKMMTTMVFLIKMKELVKLIQKTALVVQQIMMEIRL